MYVGNMSTYGQVLPTVRVRPGGHGIRGKRYICTWELTIKSFDHSIQQFHLAASIGPLLCDWFRIDLTNLLRRNSYLKNKT